MRITPERIAEIKKLDTCFCEEPCFSCGLTDIEKELLAEIESLRAEKFVELMAQEHRLGSQIDILERKLSIAYQRIKQCECEGNFIYGRDKCNSCEIKEEVQRLRGLVEALSKEKSNLTTLVEDLNQQIKSLKEKLNENEIQ